MSIESGIYGYDLEYGEVIYSSYESTYAPTIARFVKSTFGQNNFFTSDSILNGHSIVNYHWTITSERGEWLNESGANLNSINYVWPRSGGKFTVSLTTTDSVGNYSTYSNTYIVESITPRDHDNTSAALPVYEQHGFQDLIKKKKKINIKLVSVEYEEEPDIRVISIEDKDEIDCSNIEFVSMDEVDVEPIIYVKRLNSED